MILAIWPLKLSIPAAPDSGNIKVIIDHRPNYLDGATLSTGYHVHVESGDADSLNNVLGLTTTPTHLLAEAYPVNNDGTFGTALTTAVIALDDDGDNHTAAMTLVDGTEYEIRVEFHSGSAGSDSTLVATLTMPDVFTPGGNDDDKSWNFDNTIIQNGPTYSLQFPVDYTPDTATVYLRAVVFG